MKKDPIPNVAHEVPTGASVVAQDTKDVFRSTPVNAGAEQTCVM